MDVPEPMRDAALLAPQQDTAAAAAGVPCRRAASSYIHISCSTERVAGACWLPVLRVQYIMDNAVWLSLMYDVETWPVVAVVSRHSVVTRVLPLLD